MSYLEFISQLLGGQGQWGSGRKQSEQRGSGNGREGRGSAIGSEGQGERGCCLLEIACPIKPRPVCSQCRLPVLVSCS